MLKQKNTGSPLDLILKNRNFKHRKTGLTICKISAGGLYNRWAS